MLEQLLRPSTLLVVFSSLLLYAFKILNQKSQTPVGIPWIGRDDGKLFAEFRAHLGTLKSYKDLLAFGYRKYSKQDKSYVIPDFSGKPAVILPRSQLTWLIDQPEEVLSAAAFHYDALEGDYAFTDKQLLLEPFHEKVVHKYLPRRLAAVIPDLHEEIRSALDEIWGTDTEQWRDIRVMDSMALLVSRIVNRMLVGLPLCRNEEFLSNCRAFMMDVVGASGLLRFTPSLLKPFIGPLIAIPTHLHYRKIAKVAKPIIEERLEQMQKRSADPKYEWEAPDDFITWTILLATQEGRADEMTIDRIARRLLPLEFAAIHTTSISFSNCILDLCASPPSQSFSSQIADEAAALLRENGDEWNKASLHQFELADSALRESMRLSNFMTRNVNRKVMPAEGIRNPVEGWRAPRGTYLSVDMHSIQHDESIYPNPNLFRPFRFAQAPSNQNLGDTEGVRSEPPRERSEGKSVSVVTTTDTFLSFSHGRHACPGRFLVAAEFKMLLAHIVLNYDIEPLATRPNNMWFGQTPVPPSSATIRVRRKPQKT